MDNLETLKNELIEQKYAVEQKGGVVTVANRNPSPSEITAGIKSINMPDMGVTTATEEDVVYGKTFYSGDFVLKTGKNLLDPEMIHHIFMPNKDETSTDTRITYEFPTWLRSVRPYMFSRNANPLHIVFNDNLEILEAYSFYKSSNKSFENFNELTKLKTIEQSAFDDAVCVGMNYAHVPDSVTSLGNYAFRNVFNDEFRDFKYPDKIYTIGFNIYAQAIRKHANSLDLSNYTYSFLESGNFMGLIFNCDFVCPTSLQTIRSSFNYNGGFNNIILSSKITKLDNNCFGLSDQESVSSCPLKTVVFERENPPTIGTKCFPIQSIENGLKIYVPDNSVDAYKAVANLSSFVDCIYPMSERD